MANLVKGEMYRETIKRYNAAYKNGFYFECILLVYSLLEDHFTDFFVKIEFATKNNGIVEFKRNRKLDLNELDVPINRCSLDKLCNKINMVKALVEKSTESIHFKSLYLQAALNVIRRNNLQNVLTDSFFADIDAWRIKRNGIIHGLLNKKKDVFDSLDVFVYNGFTLFRTFDRCVNKLKDKTKLEIARLNKQLHTKK